jgi:hypothetical protein
MRLAVKRYSYLFAFLSCAAFGVPVKTYQIDHFYLKGAASILYLLGDDSYVVAYQNSTSEKDGLTIKQIKVLKEENKHIKFNFSGGPLFKAIIRSEAEKNISDEKMKNLLSILQVNKSNKDNDA